jgi:hypothetical protein
MWVFSLFADWLLFGTDCESCNRFSTAHLQRFNNFTSVHIVPNQAA